MIGKRGKEMNKIVWNNLIIMNSVKKRCSKNKKILASIVAAFLLCTASGMGNISYATTLSETEILQLKAILKNIKTQNQEGTIILGENAKTLKENGISGFSSDITAKNSIVIGKDGSAAGDGSIAIGKNALTGQREEHVGGTSTLNQGANGAIAIGDTSQSLTEGSIALGRKAKAGRKLMRQAASKGIAIGDGAIAQALSNKYTGSNDDAGIAIGRNSYVKGNSSIVIGTNAYSGEFGGGNILIGANAKTFKLRDRSGENHDIHPFSSIGIGTDVEIHGYNSVAIGKGAKVGRGLEFNPDKEVGNFRDYFNGVSIGYKANAERAGSIGLGSFSITERHKEYIFDKSLNEKEKYKNLEKVNAPYSNIKLHFRHEENFGRDNESQVVYGVVSVGGLMKNGNKNIPFLRQIINLADGTEDTDAVNLRQLKGLEKQINEKAGKDGKSAYEIWKELKNNNGEQPNKDKSEKDFINSLKGEPGTTGGTGSKGEKGDKGDAGKSAYEIWKSKSGNENKTEEQFLESLKGKDGKNASAEEVKNEIAKQMDEFKVESHKGDALGAALSALKPLDYDPYNRNQIMAGVSTYKGEQALALGLAYYSNESTLLHAGISYAGTSDLMANIGISYKFGSKEDRKLLDARNKIMPQYKEGVISSVYVMQEEMVALKKENGNLKSENKKLKNEVQKANERIAQLEEKFAKFISQA